MTQSTPQGRTTSGESRLPSVDPGVPNPARMWNYWLGGKDNFAADREAAERVLKVMPSMPLIARAARLFPTDTAVGMGVGRFITSNQRGFPATITEIQVTYPADLADATPAEDAD